MVSVIVPAYNAESFLPNCLNSILNQTYKDIEIIVVNDGSTDDTASVLESFSKKYDCIISINQINKGVSAARNAGLDCCHGEYVMFVDADDSLPENSMESLLDLQQKYDVDICSGTSRRIYPDGSVFHQEYTGKIEILENEDALVYSIEDHPATYSIWGKLYRSDFIKNIRFEDGRKIHEDSFFLFNCFLKKPKMLVIDTPVYNYAVNYSSASHDEFSEKYLDILQFADKKVELLNQHFPTYKEQGQNILIKSRLALLVVLSKTYDKKCKQLEKDCIQYVKQHKKDFYPINKNSQQWFRIIVNNVYPLYKLLYNGFTTLRALKSKK